MSRKISVSVALALTLIAMTVTFAVTMIVSMRRFDATVPAAPARAVLNNKLTEVDKFVRGNYYGEINDEYLGDRTARGYIEGLGDPYATYYTAEEYVELQGIESGKLVGIGVEIAKDTNGYYNIVKVYADSPADKAGITLGGRIETIDGVAAKDYSSVRVMQTALRGDVGTTTVLECRYGDTEVKSFTVQRDSYRTPTVTYEVKDNIGYIRITGYSAYTYSDFEYAVHESQKEGAKGFVFDVRGYSGTQEVRATLVQQYDQVCSMIDLLCPVGTIASKVDKTNVPKVLRVSDDSFIDAPMVVVVNGYTAGPAELFAISVRDMAGGQIVGVKTAGRGMYPTAPMRLTDGSAIIVTEAMLTTSTGESFDGVGVAPDVEMSGIAMDEMSYYMVDNATDPQILRAAELLRVLARADGIELATPAISAPTVESTPPEEDSSVLEGDESAASTEGEEDTSGTEDGASDASNAGSDASAVSSSGG